MAESFFFRTADDSVFNAIKKRKSFDPLLHSARAIIKVNGKQYFPNKDAKYQLTGLSIDENGDFMSSRSCKISIWCPTYAIFNELEPVFASLESVRTPMSIQLEWDDGIKTKPMDFVIHKPAFKFNNDGSVTIDSEGIGPGTTQLTVNVADTPFQSALPGTMFVADYGGSSAQRYEHIVGLTDYIDWTIQQGTNQGLTDLFEPEHGTSGQFNGISNPTAWWTTLKIDDDLYNSKYIAYQDSALVDSYALTYVTLSALAEIVNTYYGTDANGNKVTIQCNGDVTNGPTSFNTANGGESKVFSADPTTVIFPYTDTTSDYAIDSVGYAGSVAQIEREVALEKFGPKI